MSLALGANGPAYSRAEIPVIPALDSNLRFFGGLGVGLGATLARITPRIE